MSTSTPQKPDSVDPHPHPPASECEGQPAPDTRTRILLSAGPIFAEKGFDAATVREICQAACVNVASVKYHFGDKQNLYHDTVLFAHSCRASMFRGRDEASCDPADRLRRYIEQILFSMVVNEQGPWQVRLLMNEIHNPSDSCRQLVQDEFRPFVSGLMKAICELAAKPISTDLQITLAMSVIGQCMIYRFAPETHAMTMIAVGKRQQESTAPAEDLKGLADVVFAFSLAGIQAAVAAAD